jgi:hypothetical protein
MADAAQMPFANCYLNKLLICLQFYLRESAPCLTVPKFMEQRERLIEVCASSLGVKVCASKLSTNDRVRIEPDNIH